MTPGIGTVSVWRTLISTSYLHPGILLHKDLSLIQNLFLKMGARLQGQDSNIYISLDGSDCLDSTLAPALRPLIPNDHKLQIIFGEVEECVCDPIQKTVTIKKYTLGRLIKQAVKDLVKFINRSPQSLYLKDYGFIYDFLVRYGVVPNKISEYVKTTIIAINTRHKKKKLKRASGSRLKKKHLRPENHHLNPSVSNRHNHNSTKVSNLHSGLESDVNVEVEKFSNKNFNKSKFENSRHFPYTKRHKIDGDVESEWQPNKKKIGKNKVQSIPLNGLLTKTIVDEGEERIIHQCPSCLLYFTRRSGMYYHFRKKHPDETLNVFNNDSETPIKEKKCDLCGRCFMTISGVRHHIKRKHPDDAARLLILASISSRKLSQSKNILKHQVEEENNETTKKFKCSICDIRFKANSGLLYHWKHKHPTETKSSIKQNVSRNHDSKKIKCTLCEWRFMTTSGLRYHMKSKHNKTNGETTTEIAEAQIDNNSNSVDFQASDNSQSEKLDMNSSPKVRFSESPFFPQKVDNGKNKNKNKFAKSINCPIQNCPVLFTRRSALFCHFRNKHPSDKLPTGVNYKGRFIHLNEIPHSHDDDKVSNRSTIPSSNSSNNNTDNSFEIEPEDMDDTTVTELKELSVNSSRGMVTEDEDISVPSLLSAMEDIFKESKAETQMDYPSYTVPALETLALDTEEFELLMNNLEGEIPTFLDA